MEAIPHSWEQCADALERHDAKRLSEVLPHVDLLATYQGPRGKWSLLEMAALRGNAKCLALLLDHLDPHTDDERLPACLLHALRGISLPGHEEQVLKILAHFGVDAPLDCNGATALMIAAQDGNASLVEELLKMGANPNARDSLQCSPLTQASAFLQPECVDLLVQGGALVMDPRDKGPDGAYSAALVHACHAAACSLEEKARAKKVLELLLAHNPPLDRRDWQGELPVHWACFFANEEALRALINHGQSASEAYAVFEALEKKLRPHNLDSKDELRNFWHQALLSELELGERAPPRPRL